MYIGSVADPFSSSPDPGFMVNADLKLASKCYRIFSRRTGSSKKEEIDICTVSSDFKMNNCQQS